MNGAPPYASWPQHAQQPATINPAAIFQHQPQGHQQQPQQPHAPPQPPNNGQPQYPPRNINPNLMAQYPQRLGMGLSGGAMGLAMGNMAGVNPNPQMNMNQAMMNNMPPPGGGPGQHPGGGPIPPDVLYNQTQGFNPAAFHQMQQRQQQQQNQFVNPSMLSQQPSNPQPQQQPGGPPQPQQPQQPFNSQQPQYSQQPQAGSPVHGGPPQHHNMTTEQREAAILAHSKRMAAQQAMQMQANIQHQRTFGQNSGQGQGQNPHSNLGPGQQPLQTQGQPQQQPMGTFGMPPHMNNMYQQQQGGQHHSHPPQGPGTPAQRPSSVSSVRSHHSIAHSNAPFDGTGREGSQAPNQRGSMPPQPPQPQQPQNPQQPQQQPGMHPHGPQQPGNMTQAQMQVQYQRMMSMNMNMNGLASGSMGAFPASAPQQPHHNLGAGGGMMPPPSDPLLRVTQSQPQSQQRPPSQQPAQRPPSRPQTVAAPQLQQMNSMGAPGSGPVPQRSGTAPVPGFPPDRRGTGTPGGGQRMPSGVPPTGRMDAPPPPGSQHPQSIGSIQPGGPGPQQPSLANFQQQQQQTGMTAKPASASNSMMNMNMSGSMGALGLNTGQPMNGIQSQPQAPPQPGPPPPTMNRAPPSNLGMGLSVNVNNIAGKSRPTSSAGPVVPKPTSAPPNAAAVPATNSMNALVAKLPADPIAGVGPAPPPIPGTIPQRTRIVPVPLGASSTLIPPLSPDSIMSLKEIIKKDAQYSDLFGEMKDRMGKELNEVVGGGRRWWERDATQPSAGNRSKFTIVWPSDKRKLRERAKKRMGRKEIVKLPHALSEMDANAPELLVPVRLELDIDQHKFREAFIWNLNDPIITPDQCAQSLADDYKMSSQNNVSLISRTIQEQLSDFRSHMSEEPPSQMPQKRGSLDVDDIQKGDASWWHGWKKRLRTDSGYVKTGREPGDERKLREDEKMLEDADQAASIEIDTSEAAIETEERFDDEFRVLLKLDVVVGSMKLDDQFEWDINDEANSPEQFAEVYANELGLSGEYKTAIAHSIREQLLAYQKSLFLAGYPASVNAITDAELKDFFLPIVTPGNVARSAELAQSYTPLYNLVDEIELAISAEKEKNRKRKARQTTRRRPNSLPERDAIRTHRTPAIGFPDVDPSSLISSTISAQPVPTTSRRAAAAAASLNIANMVASENGGVPLPNSDRPSVMMANPSGPPPPNPTKSSSKVRGLFRAPTYDISILKPHAQTQGAIASTALDHSGLHSTYDEEDGTGGQNLLSLSGERRPTNRVPTAKRLKELEKAEKEREYAKRQHPNMIDGVWHCSNCGCPDGIAQGRRKGPLGDKSQCGDCGKYYHRYRKPREVVYNTDPDYHRALQAGPNKKKSAAARNFGHNLDVAATPQESLSPAAVDSPADEGNISDKGEDQPEDSKEDVHKQSSSRGSSEEPLLSLAVPSKIEPPVEPSLSPPPPVKEPTPPQTIPEPVVIPAEPIVEPLATPIVPHTELLEKPAWLIQAWEEMRQLWPDDNIESILRRNVDGSGIEWRIRCLDCPGKFYKTGPGDTLQNFEIHLRNRTHRKNVAERIAAAAAPPPEEVPLEEMA